MSVGAVLIDDLVWEELLGESEEPCCCPHTAGWPAPPAYGAVYVPAPGCGRHPMCVEHWMGHRRLFDTDVPRGTLFIVECTVHHVDTRFRGRNPVRFVR